VVSVTGRADDGPSLPPTISLARLSHAHLLLFQPCFIVLPLTPFPIPTPPTHHSLSSPFHLTSRPPPTSTQRVSPLFCFRSVLFIISTLPFPPAARPAALGSLAYESRISLPNPFPLLPGIACIFNAEEGEEGGESTRDKRVVEGAARLKGGGEGAYTEKKNKTL
jgi:hypothetical protein